MTTFEQFKLIPPGEIFRVVSTPYHNMTGKEEWLTFVCKKGYGYDDWAIYCSRVTTPEVVAQHGDKVTTKAQIMDIFPCDDETFNRYRP